MSILRNKANAISLREKTEAEAPKGRASEMYMFHLESCAKTPGLDGRTATSL